MRAKTEVDVPPAVLKRIEAFAAKKLASTLKKSRLHLLEEIKTLVTRQLYKSRIVQDLLSGASYPGNARAEFGLTDEMGQIAANVILLTVEQYVKMPVVKQVENQFEITVGGVSEQYRGDLASNPFLSYDNASYGGKVSVPINWMKWLLNKGQIDIDITEYGIIYKNKVGSEFQKFFESSRSGQAAMYPVAWKKKPNKNRYYPVSYSLTTQNANNKEVKEKIKPNPYEFPDSLKPKGNAKDFIAEALSSPRFLGQLKRILELELRGAITSASKR